MLLTLLFLSEWVDGSDGAVLDSSHDLSGDGIERCETDFIAVTYGARPEPHTHMLIGECKGRGHITDEDVRKLGSVEKRLKESGVECDLIFSTTRREFSADELALFRQYHESSSEWDLLRRAPILLTANELDFNRYAEQSRIVREVRFGEPGFSGLVRWSTEKLVGGPEAPVPAPIDV